MTAIKAILRFKNGSSSRGVLGQGTPINILCKSVAVVQWLAPLHTLGSTPTLWTKSLQ